MEEQPVRPDLKQIVYECRDLFTRLSERNRALSQEWDDFATRLEVRPDTPPRHAEHIVPPKEAASLPQAKEFGDSLLSLHERFFETCRELLQVRLENDSLKKERASLQAELARFSEKVILLGRTQADMTELKATYENQLKASKQLLEETDRNLRRMESQLAERRGDMDSLGTNLERMTQERDAALAARYLLESKISEMETTRASLGDRVQSLELRQKELHQQVGLLEEQLERAKTRAEDLELEALRGRGRIADLENELAMARERSSELENTLEQIRQTTAPVEDFLSLKRGLLQVQEERVVQAQQEAYQIETIARLEQEAQELRSRLQEAEAARSQALITRTQLLEKNKTQGDTTPPKQEHPPLRETSEPPGSDIESPAPVPTESPNVPQPETTTRPPSIVQVFETEPYDSMMTTSEDEVLPFADFAIPAVPPPSPRFVQPPENLEKPAETASRTMPPPPPVEASLFGFEDEPPVLDSLAFQEDDRIFAELTGSSDSSMNTREEVSPSGTGLDAMLEDSLAIPEGGREEVPYAGEDEPGGIIGIQEVLSEEELIAEETPSTGTPTEEVDKGITALDRTRAETEVAGPLFPEGKESSSFTPMEETSVADVLNRALAKEADEAASVQNPSQTDSVSEILSRLSDGEGPRVNGRTFEELIPEEEPAAILDTSPAPAPPSSEVPVQPVPLTSEDSLIPPTPFQPAMDFPYPEITGAKMEHFIGKRVLLVGGDERFQSDYAHLFTMVRADLLYFPSILQLEKQGMKRHVRDCDLAVVFGRAVNEPGLLRMKQVAEEYSRQVFEHPSSGLVSLYHRLQRVNDEI